MYADRICILCNLQEIEDEFHVVVRCTFYNDLRNEYLIDMINNNSNRLQNVYDFFRLMSTQDSDKLLKLTQFTYEMFNKRSQFLNQDT